MDIHSNTEGLVSMRLHRCFCSHSDQLPFTGEIVEIPDFNQPSCMRPALILRAAHQWVQVQYLDENRDFWFHELSETLHPCGFAVTLGLPLTSTAQYRETCTMNFEGYGGYPFNRYAPAFKFRPLFVPATVSHPAKYFSQTKKNRRIPSFDQISKLSISIFEGTWSFFVNHRFKSGISRSSQTGDQGWNGAFSSS